MTAHAARAEYAGLRIAGAADDPTNIPAALDAAHIAALWGKALRDALARMEARDIPGAINVLEQFQADAAEVAK